MDRKFWFDLGLATSLASLAILIIFVLGEWGLFFSPSDRVIAYRVVGALCAIALLAATWNAVSCTRAAARRLAQWLTKHGHGTAREAAEATSARCLNELPVVLRHMNGVRWRYRQPWFLLVGDDSTIVRFLPALAEHGWLVTPDAVLLWNRSETAGYPAHTWLRQLAGLRRDRPIDAVVLTLDGTAELPTHRRDGGVHAVNLAHIADTLHWSAPVYVLDVAGTDTVKRADTPVFGCELPRNAEPRAIESALQEVRMRLADRSVAQLGRDPRDRYAAELSNRLDTRCVPLANWIATLSRRERIQASRVRSRDPQVRGAFFAPHPATGTAVSSEASTSAELPLWRHLCAAVETAPGHRTGWHPVTVCSVTAFLAIGLWTAGMLVSGISNARELELTARTLQTLKAAPDSAARLKALLALQQRIDFYENRIQHHTPLSSRFGLNRDSEVLAALWRPYSEASRNMLVGPVQRSLEAALAGLSDTQTAQLDERTSQLALEGHKALKTYLMMATPNRVDAAFMKPLLMRYWNVNADLRPGERLDLGERLLDFYAEHLKAHAEWRIEPREELVNGTRQMLLAVIGVKNSEDTIYQRILDAAGNRYPDQTLSSLTAGTDTRGLLHAKASVPGVFTREAYEGTIAAAIAQAATRSETASDWVLDNAQRNEQQNRQQSARSADSIRAELESRYFADYADHWQEFMNALQWESAPTLQSTVEQLKRMADARQSPVIALVKSLVYQGGAGTAKESLSETLVSKAQNMLGKKRESQREDNADPAGPLAAAFGPVLRLAAQGNAAGAGTSELSLQRFMDRMTALRLKLQQIGRSADADGEARRFAQSLLQGQSSELADTQAYAQLVAASLGAQWAGMGEALFVQPAAQATQAVLAPAQASINDAWRHDIVANWNRLFAGRYPFANTDNDASLHDLARFVSPQGGAIASFLNSQLAGALELRGDQWKPVATGNGALAFDPAFLRAINTLQRIAGHVLAQGELQYRFDLKAVPTPGIVDTLFALDEQQLHYYNQREAWQALIWPSENPRSGGTRLQWRSEHVGTDKNLQFEGRWALVRMLERARVEPIDSATYQITWQGAPETRPLTWPATPRHAVQALTAASETGGNTAESHDNADASGGDGNSLNATSPLVPAPAEMTYPLSYLMRTDSGKGPLELLLLRGFVLPPQIFDGKRAASTSNAGKRVRADGPPPLPQAMLDAARHAETPLPSGF